MELRVLTIVKDDSFLASDNRRLFDENFAAALALLEVPQFQQYKSRLNDIAWQFKRSGIKASSAPRPYDAA